MRCLIQKSVKSFFVFSSGGDEVGNNYRWIAIPEKVGVDKTTLLGNIADGLYRSRVEDKLRGSCHPLTLGQRCADWFLLKILISGTMVELISRNIDQMETNDLTKEGEFPHNLLTKCFDS